jgi:hypothetical protein
MNDTWLLRDLPESFFINAGRHTSEEINSLFKEIPDKYKQLAYTIIILSAESTPEMKRCQEFRHLLFLAYKKLLEEHKIDLDLPHYWYADGVMIEPEWIVRITNGIIGWVCDDSVEKCLMEGECRYFKRMEEEI